MNLREQYYLTELRLKFWVVHDFLFIFIIILYFCLYSHATEPLEHLIRHFSLLVPSRMKLIVNLCYYLSMSTRMRLIV